MKFNLLSRKSSFIATVVFMTLLSSCEKNKSSREITINKYETREITLVPEVIEANSDGCVYFSFDSGKASGLSASKSVSDKNWDIAFDKINGFSNEGQKGPGKVKVFVTDYTDFNAVVNFRPFEELEEIWTGNDQIEVMSFNTMPPSKTTACFNGGISNFCTFDTSSMPPSTKIDTRVRIIKTVTGEYVKLQFIGVYKNSETKEGFGVVSFRYAFLKDTGKNALREGEVVLNDLKAGTLKTVLENKNPEEIKILTIKGSLNQEDADAIKKIKNLEILDIKDASLAITPYQYFLKDNSSSLKKIIMPSNLETIGQGWLGYCSNLEEVIVPGNSLKTVMDGAFTFDENLKRVLLPASVLTVSHEAFAYSGITEFVYPPKVKDIDYKTFYHCKNLKKVVFPESLKTIRGGAFAYCKKLTDVYCMSAEAPVLDDTYYEIRGSKGKLYPFYGLSWYNDNDEILVYFHIPKGSKESYLNAWTSTFEDYLTENE